MTLSLSRTRLGIALVSLAFVALTTNAQSPGPREFVNTPVDQTIAWVDYVATRSGTVAVDLPLPNNVSVNQLVAPTIMASFPLNDRYAGLSLTVPYSKIEVTGPAGKSEKWGFNDPAIGFHKNIFGLPALRSDRIKEWTPRTFLSVHITVNPPIGSYDRNSALNTGANRWAFTPLVNLDIPLQNGAAWLDIYAWGRFFANNNEFQGNNVLSQHPLGGAGTWYSHNIGGKKMWAAIGVYYDTGGETYVNHEPQHDAAHAFRPSVAISRKFGKFSVNLRYENTASKSNADSSNGLLLIRVGFPPLFNF